MSEITRFIGIDFGTRNTVMAYMDYDARRRPLTAEPVLIMDEGGPSIPSVTYRGVNGEQLFGRQADEKRQIAPERIDEHFKLDLLEETARPLAEQRVDAFFAWLHDLYVQQGSSLAQGVTIADVQTRVSYPAKWPAALRTRTLEAARQAGFPNVGGLDEPTAAMQYLLATQSRPLQALIQRGAIQAGQPLTVLLCDMGAGTTDLVLYRFRPGSDEGHEMLCSWPPVDQAGFFGGAQIDRLLDDYLQGLLREHLPQALQATLMGRVFESGVRQYKEGTLSPALRDDEAVPPPAHFNNYRALIRGDFEFPTLDRMRLGEILTDYLPEFPTLVRSLLKEARQPRPDGTTPLAEDEEIELVVLTGGHSQWYFIPEMLRGESVPGLRKQPGGGSGIRLLKIAKEPSRIVLTPRPQETVARGLALSGMPIKVELKTANSVWLDLKVGDVQLKGLQVVQLGETAPSVKFFHRELDFSRRSFQNIPASVTARYGLRRRSAVTLGSEQFAIEVPAQGEFDTWMKEWFGEDGWLSALGDFWDFLFAPTGRSDVVLKVVVDEQQNIRVHGLLHGLAEGLSSQTITGYFVVGEGAADGQATAYATGSQSRFRKGSRDLEAYRELLQKLTEIKATDTNAASC